MTGITGISAPVRDYTGKTVAAIGVGFMSTSQDERDKALIIKEVVTTARKISQELGHLEGNGLPERGVKRSIPKRRKGEGP